MSKHRVGATRGDGPKMVFWRPSGNFYEDDKMAGFIPAMIGSWSKYQIVEMSPSDWLLLASPSFGKQHPSYRSTAIARIKRGINTGVRFAPLRVAPDATPNAVGSRPHEGRHRALAAIQTGTPTVLTYLLPEHEI